MELRERSGLRDPLPVPPQRRRSRAVSRLSLRPLPIGSRPPPRTPIGCTGSAPPLSCPSLVLGCNGSRAGRCHRYGARRGSGCAFRGAAPGSMEGGRRGEAAVAAAAGDGPPPVFTLEEVAKRNSSREAWLVIHGRVYDVTRFLEEVRPGIGLPGPAPGG